MENKYLNRYTSLPFLLDTLQNERLTLVDPKRWEDTNDSYLLELYKEKSKKESVLALCFAQYKSTTVKAEKYHHWKIYSGTSSGVCIKFKKQALIEHFKSELGNNLRHGKVNYKTIKSFEGNTKNISLRDLPFIKRLAFNDEREYRFIYESDTENISGKDVKISLDSIAEITFNPWISISVYESLCKVIRQIIGHSKIPTDISTCLDYERWKNAGENIASLSYQS